jgi:hypothetical protein
LLLTSVHPETPPCHSEPFGWLPATKRGTGRINSAKNLCGSSNYEILRRPPEAGLLRMTPINMVSGWALTNHHNLETSDYLDKRIRLKATEL